MAELSVSVAELCSAAADLRGVVERMRSGLAGVDDELSELLGSGWVGTAGSSFGAVWQEWHEGASQVVSGLTTMAGLLETAARDYADTDAAGASALASTVTLSLTMDTCSRSLVRGRGWRRESGSRRAPSPLVDDSRVTT